MDVLLTLFVAVIVAGVAYWLTTLLPLPQPARQIAQVLLVLMLLLWVLNVIGWLGPTWRLHVG